MTSKCSHLCIMKIVSSILFLASYVTFIFANSISAQIIGMAPCGSAWIEYPSLSPLVWQCDTRMWVQDFNFCATHILSLTLAGLFASLSLYVESQQ